MHEQEPLQVEELAEGIVCGANGLSAFLASHSNTNVSLHDHWNIIGSITNR